MADKIIMWIVSFVCTVTFFSIGVYAERLTKPMWFWSGTEVPASKITDVAQYNKENGTMWKIYSLWYFAAGLAEIWSSVASAVILFSGSAIGIPLLILCYKRIYKKYSVQ